ncbi:MAG: AMP-dependent synthetase/ligase [Flammeovirgaceae bacterium]
MKLQRAFDFLSHQLETAPKQDCLAYKVNGEWKKFSTKEVVEIVNNLSAAFLSMGYKKGDKMAIISTNRPEWNFVELAMQQIGVISVPMYPTITVEDYNYIFHHAGVKLVFVEGQEIYDRVTKAIADLEGIDGVYSFEPIGGCELWNTLAEKGKKGDHERVDLLKNQIREDDLLTIIYTSGTTGRPKGVMLSHHNMVSNALGVSVVILGEGDRIKRALSFLPLCHVYERIGVYVYLYLGISVYYAESIEKIGDNVKEVKPNTFNTVPRLLEKVYDKIMAKGNSLTGVSKKLFFWAVDLGLKYEPDKDMGFWYNFQLGIARSLIFSKWQEALGGEIVTISSGAAALQPRLARIFWAANIKILQGYGLTETSPVITASSSNPAEARLGCVGKTIEGVEVKIAEDGEILCKGPNVMQGYYKDPEKTAEVMTGEWFHTGDIGEFIEGKYLKITDRKKEMFKTSGGKYIAPQLMENKFKESYLIEQIMVVGEGKKFPSALIVPNFEGLEEWCKDHNITYSSPKEVLQNAKVKAMYDKEVEKYNQSFAKWEKIKKYAIIDSPWGIDSGELTPTLKLKRRVVKQKFGNQIDAMYENV